MQQYLDKIAIQKGFFSYQHLKSCVFAGINSFDLLEEIIIEAYNEFKKVNL